MKKIFLLLAIVTLSSNGWAQKIKVKKVKGNQAVVEFTGGALQSGQVYELAPDEFGEGSTNTTSRNYALTGTISLTSTKSDASGATNETDYSISGRFGWNLGTLEMGPVVSMTSNQSGSSTATLYAFGGYADYNMIPNVPGEPFIYGLTGFGLIGQLDGGSGTKSDVLTFALGPVVKWFSIGTGMCFRIQGGYTYQKVSASSGDTTTTGLSIDAGITSYF